MTVHWTNPGYISPEAPPCGARPSHGWRMTLVPAEVTCASCRRTVHYRGAAPDGQREVEVDAAVREGLKRWAEAWSCHPCDPDLIPYVTRHGEDHKAVPFIRQAWREQHP